MERCFSKENAIYLEIVLDTTQSNVYYIILFVCLFVCLFVWLVGWLVGWLVDRLLACLLGCLVAWLLGCLVAWLLGCLVAWLLGCLVAWLVGWMDGWLDGWMVGWLVGWLEPRCYAGEIALKFNLTIFFVRYQSCPRFQDQKGYFRRRIQQQQLHECPKDPETLIDYK